MHEIVKSSRKGLGEFMLTLQVSVGNCMRYQNSTWRPNAGRYPMDSIAPYLVGSLLASASERLTVFAGAKTKVDLQN